MATTQKIVDFSRKSPVTDNYETANELSSLSAWKAFQSGMQILQRYANRSPVNIHAIAKSNLQLLHRSLSYDAQYSHTIESVRRKNVNSVLPTLQHLYVNQGLTADLLSLQKGASMNIMSLPLHYSMYLLISGSAKINADSENMNSVQHWWKRISANSNKNYLRNGSVVTHSTNQAISQMTALGQNCIILRIQIPTTEVPCKIAS